jgi:glucose/arabinose dehydrogenase
VLGRDVLYPVAQRGRGVEVQERLTEDPHRSGLVERTVDGEKLRRQTFQFVKGVRVLRMGRALATRCAVGGVLLATGLAIDVGAARAQTLSDPTLTITALSTTGLSQPTAMAFLAPDDILVLEKATGQVRRVLGGVLQPGNVLDVHVVSFGERGLLGIDINSESPPQVFLYFSEASGMDGGTPIANRVYRYTWNSAMGVLENPQLILDLPIFPGFNHNGGVVLLGPPGVGSVADGSLLHVIIGDVGRNGQLQNNSAGAAPDDSSVILRVEQDGSAAPGNPFVPYCSVTTTQTCPGGGGCPIGETCRTQVARYFAYGVRNSFGLALDPVTGTLWQTENGPTEWDEVNMVSPGMNSGWNRLMGPDASDPQGVGDLFDMPGAGSTYSDPEFSWFDTNAPTAIVFPDGSTLGAAYDDVALVADGNGFLYRFPLTATRDGFDFSLFPDLQDLIADDVDEQLQLRIGEDFGIITDLEIGPDGNLYLVSLTTGRIYRIAGPPPPPACAPTPETCRTPTVGGKSLIVLKDKSDEKDALLWKWLRGAATDAAEFGNPVGIHTYALCIYDGGGLVASATAPFGGTCAGTACWRQSGSGFRYRDPERTPDGLQSITLKAGIDARAKIIVHGKGVDLDMPGLASLTSPLTIQLKRNGSTVCWGATYTFPPALRNDAAIFKDKSD